MLLRDVIDADYQLTASSSREPRASTEATPWMESVRRSVMNGLVDEAERGIPEQKLRGRGRPPIGDEASS